MVEFDSSWNSLTLRSARPPAERRHRHLVRAAIVGVCAALVAVGFQHALGFAEASRNRLLGWVGAADHPFAPLLLIVLCGAAGIAVGIATQRVSPDAGGSGIPHVKGVLLHLRRLDWRRLLPVKFFGGALGIGAGLSLGREGPTVQMGAAVGAMVAEKLSVSPRTTLPLISCGAGAGLAAAFNAPLAGFIFVIEELHRELSPLTFGGAFVAAVTADICVKLLGTEHSAFATMQQASMPVGLLPYVVVLGMVTGLLGLLFNRGLIFGAERIRSQRVIPAWLVPGIVAACAAALALELPEAVGSGQDTASRILGGTLGGSLGFLAVLLLAKFVLTLASYASGAPGGIFAPMLLLGATVGAIVARITGMVVELPPGAESSFAVLGMAAFFCASVRAPLTGIVLIVEMTASYSHLLDICLACLAAYLVVEAFHDRPIYDALLHADLRRRGLLSKDEEAGEPRALTFVVERGSPLDGALLRDAGLPAGCLVIGIQRSGREVLPNANMKLLASDHLSLMLTVTQEKVLRLRQLTRAPASDSTSSSVLE